MDLKKKNNKLLNHMYFSFSHTAKGGISLNNNTIHNNK